VFHLFIAPTSAVILARRRPPGPPRWFQRQYAVAGGAIALFVLMLALRPLVSHPLVQVYRVEGNAMFPTLLNQDRVIARRIGDRTLQHGDIVSYQNRPGHFFVGRIVGAPRDTLVMRDFRLAVNGVPEAEGPKTCLEALGLGPSDGGDPVAGFGPVRVPDGHYFLLGDCRDNGHDSRELGFIPRDRISKQVIWCLYSPETSRIGRRLGNSDRSAASDSATR
jgi:signal peptidase I